MTLTKIKDKKKKKKAEGGGFSARGGEEMKCGGEREMKK